jgi:prepilin-type N-terminal cleavage/methylation domain-containing protein
MIFRAARRGFSLLELLLTLLLTGVIALVAVPGFLRYSRHAALAAGANQMAMDMMKVRYLAVSKNCRVRLRFYQLDRAWRWEEDLNDNARLDPLEAVSPFQYLPTGIRYDCDGVLGPPSQPVSPPSSPITFPGRVMSVGPTGRWSGIGTIYLANDYAEHAAISVSIAGRVKVWYWEEARRRWR